MMMTDLYTVGSGTNFSPIFRLTACWILTPPPDVKLCIAYAYALMVLIQIFEYHIS